MAITGHTRKRFTKHQIETAIQVLIESSMVRNRVIGEARFLGVDLDSADGTEFMERELRRYAEILIKG